MPWDTCTVMEPNTGLNNDTMGRKKWNSFEGLTPEQKKKKARTGLVLALVAFILMTVIAFFPGFGNQLT